MVDKLRGKYLFQKRGVYYFSKQIPKDVRQHYSQNRIVKSLKTKSMKDAFYQSQNLLHKLNQHWFYLRVKDEKLKHIDQRMKIFICELTPCIATWGFLFLYK